MKLSALTKQEIETIYHEHLINDFPMDELKPLSHINALLKADNYICYGLKEESNLIAYAFFCTSSNLSYLLLDYYAVCVSYRNKGYGSTCISFLRNCCKDKKGILAEVENPDFILDKQKKELSIRRIEFYKRNNWLMTPISSNVFEVEYNIIQLPFDLEADATTVYIQLDTIYHIIFPEKIYKQHVIIRSPI